MARAVNNGWDFVKVGETYQYKEDWLIAEVTILEDTSNDEYYEFKLQVEQCNLISPPSHEGEGIFSISHIKEMSGVYSGMMQLYPEPAYNYVAKYIRKS